MPLTGLHTWFAGQQTFPHSTRGVGQVHWLPVHWYPVKPAVVH
jgi:hypothetical protein